MLFKISHPPAKVFKPLPPVPIPKGPPPLVEKSRITATRLWIEENWTTFDYNNPGLDQKQLHNKMLQAWRHKVSDEDKKKYKEKEKEIHEMTVDRRKERRRIRDNVISPYTIWKDENRDRILESKHFLMVWDGMSYQEKIPYIEKYEELKRKHQKPHPDSEEAKKSPINNLNSNAPESLAPKSSTPESLASQHLNPGFLAPQSGCFMILNPLSQNPNPTQKLNVHNPVLAILKRPHGDDGAPKPPTPGQTQQLYSNPGQPCQNLGALRFQIPAQNSGQNFQNFREEDEEVIVEKIVTFGSNFKGQKHPCKKRSRQVYSNPAPESQLAHSNYSNPSLQNYSNPESITSESQDLDSNDSTQKANVENLLEPPVKTRRVMSNQENENTVVEEGNRSGLEGFNYVEDEEHDRDSNQSHGEIQHMENHTSADNSLQNLDLNLENFSTNHPSEECSNALNLDIPLNEDYY